MKKSQYAKKVKKKSHYIFTFGKRPWLQYLEFQRLNVYLQIVMFDPAAVATYRKVASSSTPQLVARLG